MTPIYRWGPTTSRLQSHYGKAVYFYHKVPRNSSQSFDRPRKDKRLRRPWGHPVVLNMGPLNWKSSVLTTRPLLHEKASDTQYKIFTIIYPFVQLALYNFEVETATCDALWQMIGDVINLVMWLGFILQNSNIYLTTSPKMIYDHSLLNR